MKLGTIFGAVTLVAITALVTTQVISQEGKPQPTGHKDGTTAAPSGQDAEMMKKMMDAANLGEQHKILAKRVGKWNYTIEWRMDENAPFQPGTGTSDFESTLGGRFIIEKTVSPMAVGQFEGMGIQGYDNVKKKYIATWADTMGTGISMSEGTADASGKVITCTGTCSCAVTGGEQKMKSVCTWVDDNHMNVVGYGYDKAGKEYKCMEIKYTRAGTK